MEWIVDTTFVPLSVSEKDSGGKVAAKGGAAAPATAAQKQREAREKHQEHPKSGWDTPTINAKIESHFGYPDHQTLLIHHFAL